MNALLKDQFPLGSLADHLLAEVAIRIQLSPTHHGLATRRYDAINRWIEREGSPLENLVLRFYLQGSMAIGATIASKLQYDEFDIDLIAELDLRPGTPPCTVLDLLESAIRGEPNSRYYDKTVRCTRCIQVRYQDGMHLDVTPMIALPHERQRTGLIFHAPKAYPTAEDRSIIANPWGFAEWFTSQTPAERHFALAYAQESFAYDAALQIAMDAAVDPVPEQQEAHEKSMAVIALQLIKRYRNVRYDQREGRCPPSVFLAKSVADNANCTSSLSDELLHQAQGLLGLVAQAQQRGVLLDVRNPTCASDVFTDRWPGSLGAQACFLRDLDHLVSKVEELRGDGTLEDKRKILAELFGEQVSLAVVKAVNNGMGRSIVAGTSSHIPGGGRFVLPSAAAAVSSIAVATPRHTYFGGEKP